MRTEDNLDALEQALMGNCGDFFGACKECRLSPAFVRRWMADDEAVKERIDAASEVGALQLESAAIQRAVKGWGEEVYFKGELCGTVTKYSDSLLQTLLKKRLKTVYGDDAGGNNILINNGQINVMPRAASYDEWLNMRIDTEKKLLEQKTGVPVEDAEFTYVLPSPEDDPAMADFL